MIKYPDGSEARVGDAIALAHRAHTGTVRHIIESAADLEVWDLDEPGLMIDTSYGGLVFHPQHRLAEDEIVFVSRAAA
jgi:hypothetical protein